jgi:hypothetical protein
MDGFGEAGAEDIHRTLHMRMIASGPWPVVDIEVARAVEDLKLLVSLVGDLDASPSFGVLSWASASLAKVRFCRVPGQCQAG